MSEPVKNVVNLYHGGDLGDTVYALPALRRLAYPVHLTLYPNHGVTRALMDENNANQIIPLINAQPGMSADWKPSYEPDGLRLDFGVRRFYKNGLNLADIHSHWVGHDHWHTEHPWLTIDGKPDTVFPIVVARSARYRDDGFRWGPLYEQFQGRACFVGVPWEHEDFEHRYGKIPYIQSPSLLEVARTIAHADVFIGNQSCPRAIAEGLKVPTVVEVGNPNNTHFGRNAAWYPALGDAYPDLSPASLEKIWCEAATHRTLGRTTHKTETLFEIARLARKTRHLPGAVLEIGGGGTAGSAAMLAWGMNRTLYLYDTYENCPLDKRKEHIADNENFLRVYRYKHFTDTLPTGIPGKERFAFVHVDAESPITLNVIQSWVLPRMVSQGIIVMNGFSVREINQYAPSLGVPKPIDRPTNFPGLYAFQVNN